MAEQTLIEQPAAPTPAPVQPSAPQQRVFTVEEVDALKERLAAEFTSKLHKVTGGKSLEAWERERLEKQGEYQKLAEQYSTEAAQLRAQLQQTIARAEILRAATDAIDPEVVHTLLREKVTITDDGQVKIEGKPVSSAIKALLTEKPYLARPAGGSGSGAPTAQKAIDENRRTRDWYNQADAKEIAEFFRKGGRLIETASSAN